MLIHFRAARAATFGAVLLTALAYAVPAVHAAPAAAGVTLHPAGFPANAATQLTNEMHAAWQITQGGGVVVAVLSTGVESVTGLSGKLTTGPNYVPVSNPDMTDGTLLASAIAGSGPTSSSPIGSIGRAPAARVLSVRIADSGSSAAAQQYQQDGTWQDILARGIRYAADHGAQVIVTDQGGLSDTSALASAVAYAISKNVAIIADGYYGTLSSNPVYPNDLPGVITGRGVLLQGIPSPSTVFTSKANEDALVCEPENELFATGPGDTPYLIYNDYAATAWLAGTVTLIKAVYPRISPAMIARALAISASYPPAGGYDTRVGFGLINPSGALQESARLLKLPAAAAPGPGVLGQTARFGSGPPPGVINAVQHSTVKLAGYSGGIVAGVVLLLVALLLRRRWRRAPVAAQFAGGVPAVATVETGMPIGRPADYGSPDRGAQESQERGAGSGQDISGFAGGYGYGYGYGPPGTGQPDPGLPWPGQPEPGQPEQSQPGSWQSEPGRPGPGAVPPGPAPDPDPDPDPDPPVA